MGNIIDNGVEVDVDVNSIMYSNPHNKSPRKAMIDSLKMKLEEATSIVKWIEE